MRLMMIDVLKVISEIWQSSPSDQGIREKCLYVVEQTKASIMELTKGKSPTHLLVVWSSIDENERRRHNPMYDVERFEPPIYLFPYLADLEVWFRDKGIRTAEHPGAEAYDMMSLLSDKLDGHGLIMVTPDRRCWSLVSEHCSVIWPWAKSHLQEVTPSTFASIMDQSPIEPAVYRDFLLLTSIKGIGPKQAAGLLRKYGDIVEIAGALEDISGRTGNILRASLKTSDGRSAYRENYPLPIKSLGMRLTELEFKEEKLAA